MTRAPALVAGVVAASAVLAVAGAYWPAMPWLHWIFKPLTTLLIAAMVWRTPSSLPRYRAWLLAGLALSTAGDVFLMLPIDAFVAGLASFLLAHVAYLLALNETISNWWLIVVIVAVAGAMPLLAKRFAPAPEPAAEAVAEDVPLELVGLARPYTDDDRIALDAALGLPDGKTAVAPVAASAEA